MSGALMLAVLPMVYVTIRVLPRKRAWRVSQRLYRAGFALLGARVRVSGLERIDPSKPYVVMANHTSFFDHFALCVALPVPLVGLEKRENFSVPIYGPLMRRWGNIPIDRSNPGSARESMRLAAQSLERRDRWLLVFPEGTRTRDGTVGPFKKGGFHLARESDVAVLPVVIRGARELHQGGVAWFRAHEIVVEVMPVIGSRECDTGSIDEFLTVVRDTIVGRLSASAW